MTHAVATTERLVVDEVAVDVVRAGAGRPLLYLHAVDGVNPDAEYLRMLAERFAVIAPWHPGFGHSDLPPEFRDIGDLAYFYLQLLEDLEVEDAVLIGSSFGGWLAAEIAIRDQSRFSHLVLIDALGIKVGGRETRDIADMHAIPQEELTRLAFHDSANRLRDYASLTDHERLGIARSREAYTYFGWRPYMHNPSLRRWLRRIRIPTLVLWGASDGIVLPDYGRAYAAEIPGAAFELVDNAGHYPHVEQPRRVVALVDGLVAGTTSRRPLASAVER